MMHAFSTFGALMSPDLPLSRKDHELIATVVSQSNCTFYCSTAHREFLRRATGDSNLVESVKADWRTADLTERERAMLEYASRSRSTPRRSGRRTTKSSAPSASTTRLFFKSR